MALTATGKPPLDLDLYIIGDSIARVPHTRFIASTNVYVEKYVDEETKKPRTDISPIEEEQLISYLTDGRIITRVHGHYESNIPKTDFDIRFTNSKAAYQAVLTTPDSALANATGANLLLYSLTILSSSLILFRFRRPVLTVSLAALIAASVFIAKATVDYRNIPKTFYSSTGK